MYKMYYIIRKDLNMSPSKLAVQVGHGTSLMFLNTALKVPLTEWFCRNNMKKIVVGIDNEEKMRNLYLKLFNDKYFVEKIYDMGLTEFDGYTETGTVLLVNEDDIPNYIKRLRLY